MSSPFLRNTKCEVGIHLGWFSESRDRRKPENLKETCKTPLSQQLKLRIKPGTLELWGVTKLVYWHYTLPLDVKLHGCAAFTKGALDLPDQP